MNVDEVTLQQWRQFLAVAEHRHFGRAAQALGMTQPPLTQAIHRIERLLGVRLFDRDRRHVRLSPAGAALEPAVRRLLVRAGELPALARAADSGLAGQVRLGFVSTVGFGPLPDWLRGFRTDYPDVGVVLREATSDVQWQAFAREELDAGLVLHVPAVIPDGWRVLPVLREPMVLALPESHRLAATRRLSLPQVLREPLVGFPRAIAPALFDEVLGFYRHHGGAPAIVQDAIQMQTIVNLVSAGLGLAWVPESVTQLRRPGVVYRALPPRWAARMPRCHTRLVWRHDAAPAVQHFVEHVRAHPASPLRGE